MTKNYFTDEQVEEIAVNAGFPVAAKHMKEELRTLMNLAVEAAIGDVVGYTSSFCIECILDGSDSTGLYRNKKDSNYEIPLYSVKELEN